MFVLVLEACTGVCICCVKVKEINSEERSFPADLTVCVNTSASEGTRRPEDPTLITFKDRCVHAAGSPSRSLSGPQRSKQHSFIRSPDFLENEINAVSEVRRESAVLYRLQPDGTEQNFTATLDSCTFIGAFRPLLRRQKLC